MMVFYQRLGLLVFIFGLAIMAVKGGDDTALIIGAIFAALGAQAFLAPWRDD